jgi:arsenate reductase
VPALARRLLAEFTGTGLLVAVVVGSGIMAVRLSPGQPGLELLENTLATVAGLAVIIVVLAPVSGAHLNPVVSAADWAVGGAVLANLMFALPADSASRTARSAPHLWLGEIVATAGLVLVVFALARSGRGALAPVTVAGWVGAAYWATSSTSFANPAVTIGRAFSDTFAGIAPGSVPGFIAAQAVGGGLGLVLVLAFYPAARPAKGAGPAADVRETAAAGAVPPAGN